jgi:Fibronectin type III domain
MPLLSLLGRLIAVGFFALHPAFAGTCGDAAISTSVTAASLPNAVQLANGTSGQPLGGTLVFTIPTKALNKDGSQLVACLRMRPRDQKAFVAKNPDLWTENLPLRVVDSQTDITTMSVELPASIASFHGDDWPNGAWHTNQSYAYDGLWPLADFRVLVPDAGGKPVIDEIIPFSITNYWLSAAVTLFGTVMFWILVYGVARLYRDVRGGFFLGIICNQAGYASLSQFQIMIWTVVIGGASIYVAMLTGRLLDVPTQTLSLLGIAGAATVAASVPKADGGDAANGASSPGKVTNLQVVDPPGATSVVLVWAAPSGGLTPSSYAIKYRTPAGAGAWTTAPGGGAVPDALFEVTGLNVTTQYEFQVTASNASGPGPGEQTEPVTTGAAAVPPAVRPRQVEPPTLGNVGQENTATTKDRIVINWQGLAALPEAYAVSYRRMGSLLWTLADVTHLGVTSLTVGQLAPGTEYQFQVSAVADGLTGPASTILQARTAPRMPEYMDLLVWDGTREIDVTRLQMLLFTLVAAFFVAVKVAAGNAIPAIPPGLLLLMGVSNGVYITSKYVTGRRSEAT